MDRKDTHFTPKAIDKQIERLKNANGPQPPSPEARMIQELQQLCNKDESRLEQIWQRLSAQARAQSSSPPPNVVDIQQYQQKSGQQRQIRRQQQQQYISTMRPAHLSGKQRLALLCTELVAALIIGSLVFIPLLLNNHASNMSTLMQTTQEHLPTNYLYMSYAQGVMSVDNKTGQMNWIYPITDYSLGLPISPLIGTNGLIYAESQDSIYAIRADSGLLAWKHTFPSQISPYPTSKARPILAGDALYVSVVSTGASMEVYELNTVSGQIQQTYRPRLNTNIVAIAIDNNTLYAFGSFDMCALNLSTGKQLWHNTVNQSLGIPHVLNGVIYTVASSEGDWLEANPSSTSYIEAFETNTGNMLWQSNPIQGNVTDIALANGLIYDGALNGTMTAYDMKTGNIHWSQAVPGVGFSGAASPQLDGNTLYINAQDPKMYYQPVGIIALDRTNGHIKWQYPDGLAAMRQEGHMFQPPVVQHGVVFVNDSMSDLNVSELYAIVDGNVLWHKTVQND